MAQERKVMDDVATQLRTLFTAYPDVLLHALGEHQVDCPVRGSANYLLGFIGWDWTVLAEVGLDAVIRFVAGKH